MSLYYQPNILYIKYNTLFFSDKPYFDFNNPNFIILNNINGITINNSTGVINVDIIDVNKYYLDIKCLNNNITTSVTIIIEPILLYTINNIKYNTESIFQPIVNPLLLNNNFTINNCPDYITFDTNTGYINTNNIPVNHYNMTVYYTVNNITTEFIIDFNVEPIFYYNNCNKYISFNDTILSDLPITQPSGGIFNTNKCSIDNNGIITINKLDVGHNVISISYLYNNISTFTIFNVYVNSEIIYDNYTCYSFTEFYTNIPYVSQTGGTFKIIDSTTFFNISNNGIIYCNAPSGYYTLLIQYTKNNYSTTVYVNFNVKPYIFYENYTVEYSTNNIQNITPIINDYGGRFNILNSLFTIDNNGLVNYKNVEPNNYSIEIEYEKNQTKNSFFLKLVIKPIINILTSSQTINFGNKLDNVQLELLPPNGILSLNIKELYTISDNCIIINNYKNVGNYNFTIYYSFNNIMTNTNYSFTVLPFIKYNNNQKILYYNQTESSDAPILNPPNGKIISDFSIDKNGVLSFFNLNVDEYNIKVSYNYLNFVSYDFYKLTVIPKISFNNPIIINYNDTINPELFKNFAILSPNNGIIEIINDYQNLNAGTYDFTIKYTVNNISNITNVSVIINKIKLFIVFKSHNKIYDSTNYANVYCDKITTIDNNVLFSEFHNDIKFDATYSTTNVGLQRIYINNIIFPEHINNNYYADNYVIKGFILPYIINPNFKGIDKIYDGNNKVQITYDFNETTKDKSIDLSFNSYINPSGKQSFLDETTHSNSEFLLQKALPFDETKDNNLKLEYKCEFLSVDCGINDIKIYNLTINNYNFKLEKEIYYTKANIYKNKIKVKLICLDKIYDSTNIANVICKEHKLNIIAEFSDSNVGNHIINIININHVNPNILVEYDIIYGNILPQKINLSNVSCIDKTFDDTNNANIDIVLSQNAFNIVSYEAYYDNKFIGYNKTVYVKNIITDNLNYIVSDLSIKGNILIKPIIFYYNGNDKIYDRTVDITGTHHFDISQNILCTYTAKFKDINSGTNKIIDITNFKLLNNNYRVIQIVTNTPTIHKKEIFPFFNSIDKAYDGNNIAIIKLIKINGIILNDKLNLISYNAYYKNDINVGCDKEIIIENIVFEFNDNYFVNPITIYGNILPKTLNIIFESIPKKYDGNDNANVNVNNIVGIIPNDFVYLITYTAKYEDSNIGIDKVIIISNITLSNNNYTANTIKILGNITFEVLNIDITSDPQEYQENMIPKITFNNFDQIVSYNAKYENIAVGIQNIHITDIILLNNNYKILDKIIQGVILPKKLNIIFSALDKYYDGTNSVIIKHNIDFELKYNAYFESIEIGNNKVIINNISIPNNNNYIFNPEYIVYANIISNKILNIEFIFNDKIYDGTNKAIINKYNILNYTDNIEIISYNAYYTDSNIGTYDIIITDIILNNNQYSCYKEYKNKGNIIPKKCVIDYNIYDKFYDGTNKVNIKINNHEILGFNAYYIKTYAENNIPIVIDNIILDPNYYIENFNIKGNIKPKPIKYYVQNNKIYLIGIVNNDNVFVKSYDTYYINGKIQYTNIILDGDASKNYSLI